ncbi:hypothetical protein D3C77_605670 [compost metagenome]
MGKHVAFDKAARASSNWTAVHVLGGDAMIHYQAALAYRPKQTLTVKRQIGMADMLEHTDTDNLVEATILRQVPVVEDLQIDLVLQALSLDPFTTQFELLFTQGDAQNLGTELPSGKS